MRISATLYLTDRTIPPTVLAGALESRGFHALYLPEHSHIPVTTTSRYPGGVMPPECARMLNPFVALAQAAAVTQHLRLGTNITLVAQHDPIDLAKQVATLDHLSDGRVTLGIGYGWNREEAADHGVDWSRRRTLVSDRLAVMRALWSPEPTSYEGESARVTAADVHPKPQRTPRSAPAGLLHGPRVLIGGAAGPGLFARIAAETDGWMPVGGSGLRDSLPALRTAWKEAGRAPDDLRIALTGVDPTPGKLAYYRDLGIDEAILQLPARDEAGLLPVLDGYAEHI
ncbi:Phthiodiolone/phenolphthiodiolone dimycocerosates ketoreductase [Streptomyces sp. YIM 130001]|uniref:TIGR03619 family F420-dependent LLM class oxidoreductase n=1 Tax=Streptomyces sp. YIM 130001 TaxID=2259644 RepID=UPI000E64AA4D|nr:TIGR03619 family F420-dependent LLM class oxidoreductase [Streptomyces sp. YIM 130001]RII11849.1 Phthiodiolone/phenolphthiodiolone dimycocerosates ketoreductase [Streptomyces sp. YIM 130001]